MGIDFVLNTPAHLNLNYNIINFQIWLTFNDHKKMGGAIMFFKIERILRDLILK